MINAERKIARKIAVQSVNGEGISLVFHGEYGGFSVKEGTPGIGTAGVIVYFYTHLGPMTRAEGDCIGPLKRHLGTNEKNFPCRFAAGRSICFFAVAGLSVEQQLVPG